MGSDIPSPTQENNEPKAEFRKLTNETTNRKYRRRSPVAGSSDEDGSPKRDHGSRKNSKASEYERRNDDRVDDRSSYRHSSRRYHNRHDDYSRYGKHADEDDRSYAKPSSRSGGESRGGSHSDYRDREGDYNKSRDHHRDVDKYSRDRSDADRKYKDKDLDMAKYDGRHGSRRDKSDRHDRNRDDRDETRDNRSSRDHRSDRTSSYEDSRGHRGDTTSKREMDDMKNLDGSKYSQEGKNKNDELDRHEVKRGGDKCAFVSEDFPAKRSKFSLEESDARKDERQASGSKQGEELVAKVASEQAPFNGSDSATQVDVAKVAAMKAAELGF